MARGALFKVDSRPNHYRVHVIEASSETAEVFGRCRLAMCSKTDG
jgi:hypothetical protein